MCRAFAADLDWDDVAAHFGVSAIDNENVGTDNTIHHSAAALPSLTFHATPKTDIAVVAGDAQGRRHLRAAYWSLIPRSSQTIDLSYPTYNARIETAASKPTYAPSAASMRAVIPASGYYEFKGEPVVDSDKIGIAVRKGDPLREKLNKALAEIKADGTYKKINDKYFPFSIE